MCKDPYERQEKTLPQISMKSLCAPNLHNSEVKQ